jgi:hypothetical protein
MGPAIRIVLIAAAASALVGCASASKKTSLPATTRPSTMPASTQPTGSATGRTQYWFNQPGVVSVHAGNFDALWHACEDAARHFGFWIDREDFRGGLITTQPLTSKQFWEFWRNDVATLEDVANSSLATYRRTLRFDIDKQKDGGFVATPRVVIERYSRSEQPITASVYLRNAFRTQRHNRNYGTRETDRGVALPRKYWYATGRDEAIEREVAKAVAKRLTPR